jgi:succinate-semialdehyde dehydrogenase/glutarate-semialdehyde dehydrogenase
MGAYAVVKSRHGRDPGTYPLATDADVEQALASADAAAKGWAHASTVAERATLIRKVAELHRERRDDLAAIMAREMGKQGFERCGNPSPRSQDRAISR